MRTLYDDLYRSGRYGPKGSRRSIHRMIALRHPHEKVLDVGCGDGQPLKAAGFPPAYVVGLDFSIKAVSLCQDKGYTAVWADATNLPFKDRSFPIVHSAHMLEHLEEKDAKQAIREMMRVASRMVVVEVPNGPDAALKRYPEIMRKHGAESLHLTQRPLSWWQQEFEALGGQVKEAARSVLVVEVPA